MGWLISIALLVSSAFIDDKIGVYVLFIASGLFGIAGSIGSVAMKLDKKTESDKDINKPVS